MARTDCVSGNLSLRHNGNLRGGSAEAETNFGVAEAEAAERIAESAEAETAERVAELVKEKSAKEEATEAVAAARFEEAERDQQEE